MLFYVKVGWRNLWRNTRRTILTSSAMAVSVGLCMALMCLTDGMYDTFYDVLVTQNLGHVQIHHPDYPRTRSMYDSLQNVDDLGKKIEKISGLKGKSTRLYGNFLAGGAEKSAGAQIVGFDPEVEKTLGRIATQVKEGDYLSSAQELEAMRKDQSSDFYVDPDPMNYPKFDGQIIVGTELAKSLDSKIGDTLLLLGMNSDGGQAEGLFKITGIYKTGSVRKDRGAMTHLSSLQNLMGLENQVHEMVLIGANAKDQEAVAALSNEVISKLELPPDDPQIAVKSWMETSPQTMEMMKMRDITMFLFLGLVFFIATFGILNTMLMSVFERTRELGVLKALGLRPLRLVKLVIVEAIMLSIFAAMLGLLLGGIFDWLLITYGINLEVKPGEGFSFNGAVFDPVIRGSFEASSAIAPAIALIFVSIFAAIWPAIRAARLEPVDAIKQD